MIPEDWEVSTLEQIALEITDGSHFSPRESPDGDKIIATVKNMRYNGFSFEDCKRISDDAFDQLVKSGCSPDKGDILISKDGANCLDLIFVYDQDKKIVLLSSIAIVRLKEGFDPQFYRYYLLSPQAQKIMREGYVSGTAIPRVILKNFKRVPIPIPDFETQNKIGNTLWNLDKKIELNQQMNKTLEDIGLAIFKRWFIDFEFPNEQGKPYKSSGGEMVYNEELGKEIPKGWKDGKIGDICAKSENGGTPSRRVKEYWENGTISWFKTGELNDGPLFDSEEKITELGLKNSSCKVWMPGTILVAMYGATAAKLGILTKSSTSNQACNALFAKEEYGNMFLFFTLLSVQRTLFESAVGAAQQNLNKDLIANQKIILPPSHLCRDFHCSTKQTYQKIVKNSEMIITLTKIRDSLLPKLMSGKIRVPVEA